MKLIIGMHEACGNDDLRPQMTYVKLTKEKVMATDAHIGIIAPTNEVFDEDFISGIPEDGVLIHKDDWKLMTQSSSVVWKDKDVLRLISTKKRDILVETLTEDNVGKFPDLESVFPDQGNNKPQEISRIGINPEMTMRVFKALKPAGSLGLKFTFYGETKAILLTPTNMVYKDIKAIAMPIMFNI